MFTAPVIARISRIEKGEALRNLTTLADLLIVTVVLLACSPAGSAGSAAQAGPSRSPAQYGAIDLYVGEVYQGEQAIALLGKDAPRNIDEGWKSVVVEVIAVNTGNQSLYISMKCAIGCEQELLDSQGFPHRAHTTSAGKSGFDPYDYVMLPGRGFRVAYYLTAKIPDAYEVASVRLNGFCIRSDTFVWGNDKNYETSVTLDIGNAISADGPLPATEDSTAAGPAQGFPNIDVSISSVTRGKVCMLVKNNSGENISMIEALASAYDVEGYLLHDKRVELVDPYKDSTHLAPGREKQYCVSVGSVPSSGWQQISPYIIAARGRASTAQYHTRTYWFLVD